MGVSQNFSQKSNESVGHAWDITYNAHEYPSAIRIGQCDFSGVQQTRHVFFDVGLSQNGGHLEFLQMQQLIVFHQHCHMMYV